MLELMCDMIGDTPQKDMVHQELDQEEEHQVVELRLGTNYLTRKDIKPVNIYGKLFLSSLICLCSSSNKFCHDIDKAIKQFNQNFYLKVFVAKDDQSSGNEESIKKLQINSVWKPDQPPHKITKRIGDFEEAIARNFHPQCRKSNLTKFQATILQQICRS